jgi:DNA ligase-1
VIITSVLTPWQPTTYAAVVGIEKCKGIAHLKETLALVEKYGGEGLMLRRPGSLYQHGNVLSLSFSLTSVA